MPDNQQPDNQQKIIKVLTTDLQYHYQNTGARGVYDALDFDLDGDGEVRYIGPTETGVMLGYFDNNILKHTYTINITKTS